MTIMADTNSVVNQLPILRIFVFARVKPLGTRPNLRNFTTNQEPAYLSCMVDASI